MPDNVKLTFGGTGTGDLQIFHDGSNSFISDTGTGSLILRGSSAVALQGANGENGIIVSENGAVDLRYNNATKLATTNTGVTVTGEMAATTMDLSSNAVIDGTLAVGAALSSGYNASITGGLPLNIVATSTANSIAYGGVGVTRQHTGVGQGTGIGFQMNSADGTNREYAYIGTIIESNADGGGQDGSIGLFPVLNNGRVQRFTVKSNGNVGIGTSTPGRLVEINNATNPALRLNNGNSNADIGIASSAGAILTGAADDDLVIARNGAFGISLGTNGAARLNIAADGGISTPTAGANNVRLGLNAGDSIVANGIQNVCIGDDAGTTISTGDNNIAIGFQAGDAISTGANNIAIGKNALSAEDTHDFNIAIGSNALAVQNAGADTYNIAIGHNAGALVTTGIKNNLIGGLAGDALTEGNRNVAVGTQALSSDTKGSRSTAIGQGALFTQNFTSATETYNTAVGYEAGVAVTTALNSTLIGALAGDAITSGNDNLAVGKGALTATTTGVENTAVGNLTLRDNETGGNNTAFGYGALTVNTVSHNTSIGYLSGVLVNTGHSNTFLGSGAGGNVTSGDSNIMIGKDIDAQTATADNQINIGGQIISDNTFVTIPKVFRAGDATASALTHGTADRASSFVSALQSDSTLVLHNTNASYDTYVQRNSTVRAANSAFTLLGTTTGNLSDDQHRLRGDGQTLADGAYSSGGADYAEYFEWADGNSDNEDRRGCSVVLSGSKMRIATSDDSASNIIGVISSNASVIGDGDMSRWKNKYLRDDFGGYDLDSNGDRKPNPNYNPDLEYVSRELRLEWETVGLMGKLRIKKGQPIGTNWIKMRDVSDQVEEWLVR